jgi:Cu-Zn family superoxide dismutase
MKSRILPILGVALAASLVAVLPGCRSTRKGPVPSASAVLMAKSGSTLKGLAVFTRLEEDWIHVRIEVEGVSPGLHAVHLHEHGDCTSPDGSAAGGHWDPTKKKHGKWMQPDGEFHLGDLGNIEVGPDGTGYLELTTTLFGMGCGCEKDIVGRSIIVHAKADDFTTQPTGAAGGRIGQGVVLADR